MWRMNPCMTSVHRGEHQTRFRASAVGWPHDTPRTSATGHERTGATMDDRTHLWNDFAAQLAVDSIRCTTAANSGHPTSSMSAAHLIAVLYADHLRTNVAEPTDLANDRFVLSKGHAAPVLYAALKAIGAISDEELL